MPTYPFPTNVPEAMTVGWRLQANTQTFESPLDRTVQTLELVGARWRVDVSWVGLIDEEWRPLTSFIAKLRGAAGRFTWFPPHARTPRGAGGGTPLVKGAGQLGASLDTDGWPTGTVVLKDGDFFSVVNGVGGYELKQVIADVTSDGSGNATITFEPPLRHAPGDNQPLVITDPLCLLRLVDDDQGMLSIDQEHHGRINLSAVEVF